MATLLATLLATCPRGLSNPSYWPNPAGSGHLCPLSKAKHSTAWNAVRHGEMGERLWRVRYGASAQALVANRVHRVNSSHKVATASAGDRPQMRGRQTLVLCQAKL